MSNYIFTRKLRWKDECSKTFKVISTSYLNVKRCNIRALMTEGLSVNDMLTVSRKHDVHIYWSPVVLDKSLLFVYWQNS